MSQVLCLGLGSCELEGELLLVVLLLLCVVGVFLTTQVAVCLCWVVLGLAQ